MLLINKIYIRVSYKQFFKIHTKVNCTVNFGTISEQVNSKFILLIN